MNLRGSLILHSCAHPATMSCSIAVDRVRDHLEKHGSLKMRVSLYKALYERMMSQDMAYFEQKFKKKDQVSAPPKR